MDNEEQTVDDLTTESTYDGIDIDNNRWTEESPTGEVVQVIGADFENGIKRIHLFVEKVRHCNEPAFELTVAPSGRMTASRTSLGAIPTSAFITPKFLDGYEVSEQVRIFLEAEEELLMHAERHLNQPLRPSLTQPGRLVGHVANEFVKRIRTKCKRKNFRRRLGVRRMRVEENFRRGKELINALFRRYARLNVVRIDLGYLSDHRAGFQQAKEDLARFLNNRRHKSVFRTVVATVWHMEWGVGTGYHWHVMLFLDGSKTRHDGFIAQQFCDYWDRVISGGRGRSHNCNFDKNRYKQLGIGVIDHADKDKRDVLLNLVLRYLTKADELVRPRTPRGSKTFSTSEFPEPHPGTGRRRQPPPLTSPK